MANGEWRINTWRFLRRPIFYSPFAILYCLFSCTPAPQPPPPLADSAERGPIRFSAEVSSKQAWIGEPITLTLRATTPEDTLVEFPARETLGDVNVQSEEEPQSQPTESGLRWEKRYIFDTLSAGGLEIPPLVLQYGTKPAQGEKPDLDNELAIGTLKLDIRSALTSQDSPMSPRDITGARTPAAAPWTWQQIALAVGGAALAAVLAVLLWRTWLRRKLRPAPPPAPELVALAALAELEKFDWIGVGEVREYYYRLSEIVRAYIESKFNLRAPEMTTEEFLVLLAGNRSALPYDADKLRRFLEACDLVKYAALAPQREDGADALSSARAFVQATAAAADRAAAVELEGRAA
ncbi:MAG: hypothetical protein HZB38_15070 [Planctomycetes bacterium]|nr:hypothetical protein [Planctomycetota bacterium]